jgi:hypothetical protein
VQQIVLPDEVRPAEWHVDERPHRDVYARCSADQMRTCARCPTALTYVAGPPDYDDRLLPSNSQLMAKD